MAIHYSVPSMLQESLIEMVLVADYCIKFRKNPKIWNSKGCFGYPAAILLLSVADAIGSYVLDGSVENHFKILKHKDYYNLGINDNAVSIIYKNYRCLLNHNAVMKTGHFLDIGNQKSPVFEMKNNMPFLNLSPFLKITKKTVIKFLQNTNNIVMNNKQINNILRKRR